MFHNKECKGNKMSFCSKCFFAVWSTSLFANYDCNFYKYQEIDGYLEDPDLLDDAIRLEGLFEVILGDGLAADNEKARVGWVVIFVGLQSQQNC